MIKKKPEATPATSRPRMEKSHNNQSPEKRKTKQQKHASEERKKKRQNSCKTERKKRKLQRRKIDKKRPNLGKPRKRNISRKDKDVKELLSDETI